MPFLLHSITLDWSIGLIPEFRFHLTNSLISILDQTPKPLYFSPKKSRFSELGKKGKNWSIWGGRNLKEFFLTSNYYHFLDPPNLQILRLKLGNPGAYRILAAPGFANFEGPNWEILRTTLDSRFGGVIHLPHSPTLHSPSIRTSPSCATTAA